MLWASPPDDGADADGRFDVDSVLVTEFLLSFVGTLAGLKLSSDIAACIERAEAFQSLSALRGYERSYRSRTAPQRRGGSAYVSRCRRNRSKSYGAAHKMAANQLGCAEPVLRAF